MPTLYQQLIAAGRSESGQALIEALGDCPLNVTPAQYAEADQALGLGRQTAATNGWAVSYWLLKSGAYARAASGDFTGAVRVAAGIWPACGNVGVSANVGVPSITPEGVTLNAPAFDTSIIWIIAIGAGALLLLKRYTSD